MWKFKEMNKTPYIAADEAKTKRFSIAPLRRVPLTTTFLFPLIIKQFYCGNIFRNFRYVIPYLFYWPLPHLLSIVFAFILVMDRASTIIY